MPMLTIVFGGLLIVLGVVGFVLTGSEHPTALIPAFAGILFEICGGIAMIPGARKHAMHAAVMVGLFGFLAATIQLVRALTASTPQTMMKLISLGGMASLTLLFVLLCVRSFINARRGSVPSPTGRGLG